MPADELLETKRLAKCIINYISLHHDEVSDQ